MTFDAAYGYLSADRPGPQRAVRDRLIRLTDRRRLCDISR